jgi:hypothetical protein
MNDVLDPVKDDIQKIKEDKMIHYHNGDVVAGTVGGTLLTIFAIPAANIVETIILAALGALVSFFTSYLLKTIFKKK